jgi:membrane protein
MIQAADQPLNGIVATLIGVITLIVGATGVLSELKTTLNKIWRIQEPDGLQALVKQNAKFLGLILAIGFLLLVSLAFSAGLAALGKVTGGMLPIPETLLHGINFIISFGIITVLFAAMFKVLPNVFIAWRDVWVGASVTSFLFSIGKLALGLYLGKGSVGSAYGSAGSILIVLMWVYYSGLIFYFGAEFTRVYAEQFGSRAGTSQDAPEIKKVA